MTIATTPAPSDTISLDHQVLFDNGTFTVTGTATSSVGVQSVKLVAFTNSGDVTLGLLREAYSLVLISMTLQSDLARGAAEGINDRASDKVKHPSIT